MAGDAGAIVLDEGKDDNSAEVSPDDRTGRPFDGIGVLGIMRADFLDGSTDIAVRFVPEDEAVEYDCVAPCSESLGEHLLHRLQLEHIDRTWQQDFPNRGLCSSPMLGRMQAERIGDPRAIWRALRPIATKRFNVRLPQCHS